MRARLAITGPDADAARMLLAADGIAIAGPGQPADLLVVDEWTPEDAPHVLDARAAGVPTTVLAELIVDRAPGPVVAVTGTAGKTSTCRALADILRSAGRAVAISDTARSANAWPDHSLAPGVPGGAVLVAELTSTHLCHMRAVHPDVAVVTTIRPDHGELHGGLQAYFAAKRRLVEALTPDDAVVLPTDDPATLRVLGPVTGRRWGFGQRGDGRGAYAAGHRVVLRDDACEVSGPTRLDGTRLRAALAGAAAAMAVGVPARAALRGMSAVSPVAHRMRARPGPRGTTIIDDSMAATPPKAMAALADAPTGEVVMVVGGDDAPGGRPVHALAEEAQGLEQALRAARERATLLVAFGPAATRVAAVVQPDVTAPDLAAALATAVQACPDGGTVLVSPMFPVTPADRLLAAGAG